MSSLEGYGAPTIDIGLECVGERPQSRSWGSWPTWCPTGGARTSTRERERINIDDADMFMAEAANGALFSLQSSYVTVGNYPGIEARIFGSEGAIRVRLVEEFGVIQTIHTAKPDAVEFVQREIPAKYFPPGYQTGDAWSAAFYGNLVHNFCEEIRDGGATNQGNFAQSARVQEIINAVTLSHRAHRWVDAAPRPGRGRPGFVEPVLRGPKSHGLQPMSHRPWSRRRWPCWCSRPAWRQPPSRSDGGHVRRSA